ncbi:MAG: hypothetical protein E7812_13075 [Phenylobacterium sp.]|nr:MAG: hypothetical protein E7812_13075 [Phenylobacterium sp.]
MRQRAITLCTVSAAEDSAELRELSVLHERTFGRPSGLPYYRWMYGRNPERTTLVAAECEGEILGALGVRRRQMASGLVCAQLMDMIVAPACRGSGLFADMAGRAMETVGPIDFWFSHANPGGAQALVRKAAFEIVGRIAVLEGARGRLSAAGAHSPSQAAFADATADRLVANDAEATWRFGEHPLFAYSVLGTSAMGPVIAKEFADGDLSLLDLMTPFQGRDLPELIRAADDGWQSWSRIYFWSAPHLSAHAGALAMGFAERAQARYLVGRATSVAGQRLADFSQWFVSASDTEYM